MTSLVGLHQGIDRHGVAIPNSLLGLGRRPVHLRMTLHYHPSLSQVVVQPLHQVQFPCLSK
jgi:hypothetical protein